MSNPARRQIENFAVNQYAANTAPPQRRHQSWGRFVAPALTMLAIALFAVQVAQSQTFTVLHSFTGGPDGYQPVAGLIKDSRGNLYGTTYEGGPHYYDYGVVFKLDKIHSNWILSPLAEFARDSNGYNPESRAVFGPNAAIYSTTLLGGTGCGGNGCGTVFQLVPPPSISRDVGALDSRTVIYRFSGPDGADPIGDLTFDREGNLYGTTIGGGAYSAGTVYELTSTAHGWVQTVLYSFTGGADGGQPYGGVILDAAGNLYGTTGTGGAPNNYGVVFKLTPSAGGWTEQVLHTMSVRTDGGWSFTGLIFDSSGNLYGTASVGGSGEGGTVFELSPSNGGWNFSVLYAFPAGGGYGPEGGLLMDAAGNLYGTTLLDGANEQGSVYKLTPSNGGWIYTDLHDFGVVGNDGMRPICTLVMDTAGNLYGTSSQGGQYGGGSIFEITP